MSAEMAGLLAAVEAAEADAGDESAVEGAESPAPKAARKASKAAPVSDDPGESEMRAMAAQLAALGDYDSDEDAPAPKANADEPAEDVTEDEPESEEESDDDAEADAPPAPVELDPSTKVKVKVNGQESEVALADVIASYQTNKAITEKGQKVAEERSAFEGEKVQTASLAAEYAQGLAAIRQSAEAELGPEPDWAALRQQMAPQDYAAAYADRQHAKEQIRVVAAKEAEAAEYAQRVNADRLRAHLESERGKLTTAIPEWADTEVAKKDRDAMMAFAKGLGYTDGDLSQVYDHRLMLVLRKAMLFDRLQSEKPAVQRQLEKVKAATPGAAASAKRPASTAAERAARQFKKNPDDMGAAIASLVGLLPPDQR